MTNEARKTQELISTFIRETGIDEHSAKKCVNILAREMFRNGLSYDYQVKFWNAIIERVKT
tara:strand:+ start:1168 stop:1350 length:183 start_codon:yes stop_codon:yes gene_type:complete